MHIYDGGVYVGSLTVNANGYMNNTDGTPSHGLPTGTYAVLPKPVSQYQQGDIFLPGTPSVTGLQYLNEPGKAASGYKPTVRIHLGSAQGADSLGCITVNRTGLDIIQNIMENEISHGGILYLEIVTFKGAPYATPTY
jgi:hypothetical protein